MIRIIKNVPIKNILQRSQSSTNIPTTSKTIPKLSDINFSNPQFAFKNKSFMILIRTSLVFTICQIRPFVVNAERMLKLSYKLLGETITNPLLKLTFFGHFCAGEDEKSIRPTVQFLEQNGIGSILDYAAESDIEETIVTNQTTTHTGSEIERQIDTAVVSREYDYKNEEMCDTHAETFRQCIKSVHNVSPTGFAAIKCTALGDPELLKRASIALQELRKLFVKLDKENTGFVKRDDFLATFANIVENSDVNQYFDSIDVDRDGKIDYVEWSNGIPVEDLHLLTEHCTVAGPLKASVLNGKEVQLLKRTKERIYSLAELAESLGVRLMIDAEHTYFQPAIDSITNGLTKTFNKPGKQPVIFSTYQMYLKDSRHRLLTDMERAKKGNYTFAAKLVRGAYMSLERAHAELHDLPDPILDSIEETHKNYNNAIKDILMEIKDGKEMEIMIATHNQKSVEAALECMVHNNIPKSKGIYFGQLLGMSDHLTFTLGAAGYKAYKYVPYGKVKEVMPYLLRRAQENADALSGAKYERGLINKEIVYRFKNAFGLAKQ